MRFFQTNRDIFLRILYLITVALFFTSTGVSQGEIVLAVNTLLMQLLALFSYIMDDFACAGEALSGRYIGVCNRKAFTNTTWRLFIWGGWLAAFFTLVYALDGNTFLRLLTDNKDVVSAAGIYFYQALAIPVAGIAASIWDGTFIGTTATHDMLASMATAAISFFVVYYGPRSVLDNHALWLAFLVYPAMRGVVQTLLSPKIIRENFTQP